LGIFVSKTIKKDYMKIVEVNDKKSRDEFLKLPVRLYKKDPNWIRPLDNDIESVFDPKSNKMFRHGECSRWILKDDKGITIGRVAAFINHKTAKKDNDQPTGGMGFFECINDNDASFMLFDKCKNWLQERGMEAMDGPINFGERDRWWGLLVDGFTEPNYCTPYNPPYYKDLFEAYGFQLYFKQYTYARKAKDPLLPKIQEKAERIAKDPNYSFRTIEKKNLEKYAEDFRYIFNKAWAKHLGVREMYKEQAMALMNKLKPVLDERIIWFGYYEEEPIAFYINLPELNQIFRHVNGKLDLIGKLKFLWYRNKVTKMFGVSFGVIPEYQGRGVEGALAISAIPFVWSDKCPYVDVEMNWIGDFNPKMMHVCESIGAKIAKTHITFRKLFDETKPFKRMAFIR
jgi:hypothetical protein